MVKDLHISIKKLLNIKLREEDLLEFKNELIRSLKRDTDKQLDLLLILFVLQSTVVKWKKLGLYDNYLNLLSIIFSYFIENEIRAWRDPECSRCDEIFDGIFSKLTYYIDDANFYMVLSFVRYFIRNDHFNNLKGDPILRDWFCKIFERLFLNSKKLEISKHDGELGILSFLLIYKIWIYTSRTNEEKNIIERMIAPLYNLDTVSLYLKKICSENQDNVLNFIQINIQMIQKMLFNKDNQDEFSANFAFFSIDLFNFECFSTVYIEWLSDFVKDTDYEFISAQTNISSGSIQIEKIDIFTQTDSKGNFVEGKIYERNDYGPIKRIFRRNSYSRIIASGKVKRVRMNRGCNKPVSERIKIILRKQYVSITENCSFKQFKHDQLISLKKKDALNKIILDEGWNLMRPCFVRIQKIDNLELTLLMHKKLPIEYFTRSYSSGSLTSEIDQQNTQISLNSSPSIEILEKTIGSRAQLYCREVDKTLKATQKNL